LLAERSGAHTSAAEDGSGIANQAEDGSSQPTVIPLSAAGDALPNYFQSLRCSQSAASDAASEVSYFTDRWMPGGLLDEDGASRSAVRSALNPEAGSFEPRGYMPQVAEDDENRQRTEAAAAPEEKERAAAERAAVL